MGSEAAEAKEEIHIFFFPFMAQGHMIPAFDMAKLFTHRRRVKATLIATPSSVPLFSNAIRRSGVDITIRTLDFPSAAAGLPDGTDSLDKINAQLTPEAISKFFQATAMLQGPLELLLEQVKPDCLVADIFFPWATAAAAKFGIPRLVFHGTGFFSLCATECIRLYEPFKTVDSDSEPFTITHLPGDIQMTKKKLPEHMFTDEQTGIMKMLKEAKESELTSYGVVVNSFYELEPVYADYYRNFLGRKAWHIGPVSLCNRDAEDKTERGNKSSIDEKTCLTWLDSKQPNSVLYVCFGSMAKFTDAQLKEIALGLEAGGQNFLWVVKCEKEKTEEWLPEGFEERTGGKGLIIRGWAPQVLILDHPAVGAFISHCGWNSTLESISAGVPLVTWPLAAEQFYNEQLLSRVLGIGVSIGVEKWVRGTGDFVRKEQVEKVVAEIMNGEKAREMRNRAKELAETAKRAVEDGGSSHSDLTKLLDELSIDHHLKVNGERTRVY